ncbi:MAG: hypothetical protein DA330_02940 [Nitrososphaera sp.]|nr:hypothetical protein [Nitrososphaera sp.]
MASSDSFAVEQGKGQEAVTWMNEYAKKNNMKFEAKLQGYSMQTGRFGSFELISWKGDWSVARSLIKRASGKLRMKVLESGYSQKTDLISSFLGAAGDYAKVYSGGNLVGQIEMVSRSGKWTVKSESF